jgi:hypothetical protein
MQSCRLYKDSSKRLPAIAAQFELLLDFCLFWVLSNFRLILAENCFVTIIARTVDWQAGDCVLLAHAELQTVLGQSKAASYNAAA